MANEVAVYHNSNAMLFDTNTFAQAQRAANLFASSKLVPAHFQGKVAECFIGLLIANRMKEDPLTVMQNLYIVSGKPGWMTQYMIGRANNSGIFKGRITWDTEGSGDTLKVTAKATLADSGEAISVSVDMKMAKAEGWTKNSKYQSMPEHMFRWRSAAMLIRLYAPEVMLGYQTAEEVETLPMQDVTPLKEDSIIANINASIKAETQTEESAPAEEPDDLEQAIAESAAVVDENAPVPTIEPQQKNGGLDWNSWKKAVLLAISSAPSVTWLAELQQQIAGNLEAFGKESAMGAGAIRKAIQERVENFQ